MPVLGKKSPTPALPNLIGKGKKVIKCGGDMISNKGMVVPQLGKLFTENMGHSGNKALAHPAETLDLSKMILPRGGSRRNGESYKITQFRDNSLNEPNILGEVYLTP